MTAVATPAGERSSHADHRVKKARLMAILERHGAERLILSSQTALAWYLDGARIHVNLSVAPIVAMLVSTGEDELVLTDNESARLRAEELPDWVAVREVGWQRSPLDELLSQGVRGTILEETVETELRAARSPLLESERARFRALGSETASLLTDVLISARPDRTERSLAAAVAGGVVDLGADPLVVLVGGAARRWYRHPLPTVAPIGRRSLIVVCARRAGLIVNLSRWVRFGPAGRAEASADRRILDVEAAYLEALRPGTTLGEVFSAGLAAYAPAGFAADESSRHHQGGVAGYAGRDPRATAGAADRITTGQAFSWSPSAPGCKVEDTVLLGGGGLEFLTADPRWPETVVAGRRRPAVLELPG